MRLVSINNWCLLQLDKMFDEGEIIFMFSHPDDDRDNEHKQVIIEISNCQNNIYQLFFWPNGDGTILDLNNKGNVKIIGVDNI